VKVESPVERPTVLRPESRRVYSRRTDRRLVRLTERTALFWVEWEEEGHRVSTLFSSGPVSCNDVEIGDPPEGMIAARVPFGDHAKAMFVPDPERQQRGRAASEGAKD
jgi:hypothetical protein